MKRDLKFEFKKMISFLCVTMLALLQPIHVFAEEAIPDEEGNLYLIYGGYMCSDRNELVKHSLNPVNCYIDIDIDTDRSLWMAAYGAIQDWDWHLSYISQYKSTQQGYDRDIYGFSMECNQVYYNNSDIRISCTEGYIVDEYGQTLRDAYALTTPYTFANDIIREEVMYSNYNWRYAEIVLSKQELNDYSLSHTNEETQQFMRRVVNHEIGHALGLTHDTRDNGILMYGPSYHGLCTGYVYDDDDMTATVPTLHDLIGIYLIYG
ncbi:MAG: matrixin family metalloprotease [Clostridia bacterium]|nr:matrixin family metalloprotease [Clostridia bacterium]